MSVSEIYHHLTFPPYLNKIAAVAVILDFLYYTTKKFNKHSHILYMLQSALEFSEEGNLTFFHRVPYVNQVMWL